MQYWWVNQGKRYRPERRLGDMFSPQKAEGGAKTASYKNMLKVEVGDICLHYADGELRSLSSVTAEAVPAKRPRLNEETKREMDTEGLDSDGYLIKTTYFDLTRPIQREEIPIEWRTPALGPFATGEWTGRPKIGYLWPVTAEFVEKLSAHFPDRWPSIPQ